MPNAMDLLHRVNFAAPENEKLAATPRNVTTGGAASDPAQYEAKKKISRKKEDKNKKRQKLPFAEESEMKGLK